MDTKDRFIQNCNLKSQDIHFSSRCQQGYVPNEESSEGSNNGWTDITTCHITFSLLKEMERLKVGTKDSKRELSSNY